MGGAGAADGGMGFGDDPHALDAGEAGCRQVVFHGCFTLCAPAVQAGIKAA